MLTTILRYTLGLLGRVLATQTPKASVVTLFEKLYPVCFEGGMVRLGPNGDGGYLVPDDLTEISFCVSPGVSIQSGFEHDCANRGMICLLADGSVDGPALQHENFRFTKKFVGAVSDGSFMTLNDWLLESAQQENGDMLMQMDIEGYEYETILSTSDDLLKRFRIIIIEFHMLDHLWNFDFFKSVQPVFEKLLKNHIVVHSHPNNAIGSLRHNGLEIPPLLEVTFLRRDRFNGRQFVTTFPHPLDQDCCSKASLVLPKCLYNLKPNSAK